jgi:hypothetical protein
MKFVVKRCKERVIFCAITAFQRILHGHMLVIAPRFSS